MTQPRESDPPRREFLQRLVTTGAAVAGTGLLAGCASMAGAAAPAPSSSGSARPATASSSSDKWDMSWTKKLGKHRTAYDSPEIQHGAALFFAQAAIDGYREVGVAPAEVTPVLILRHTASVMVLNDAMWATLAMGESHKLKDPATGEPAKRNPFINHAKGDKHAIIDEGSGVDTLVKSGAIVLTCNRALGGVAWQLRKKDPSLSREQSIAAVRAAVLPGVYVMPNGIFAVSAAQDAGCHYMRVLV
jgi:hypothetical protein